MLHRVLDALVDSALVGHVSMLGPAQAALERDNHVRALLDVGRVSYLAPQRSPALSVSHGLAQRQRWPMLVTTADHALLRREMVDYFLRRSAELDCDVTVAVTPLALVHAAFPDTRRTAIRLKGGPYCGSNLFAFMTPEGSKVARFWTSMEQTRKQPRFVVAKALGPLAAASYLLGKLSLERAMAKLSATLQLRIGAVIMPFAEAAVDVDTPSDFNLVERALQARAASSAAAVS